MIIVVPTLCTNNGRYCASDPDQHLDRGFTGADVVRESLRWLCIWKDYGEEDGIGRAWWNYAEAFIEECASYEDNKLVEDCACSVYKYADIDAGKIDRCMSDSGGLEGDARNSLFDLELKT